MRWEEFEKKFDVCIPEDEPVYPVNVVCSILHLQYWTVHELMREGVVPKSKKLKNSKLLSHKDIRRLKYVKYLMEEKGVNVKGVKVLFQMHEDVEK